jgi:hypothetical protein
MRSVCFVVSTQCSSTLPQVLRNINTGLSGATMTRPYAAGTSVSAEKSRAELETMLGKYGATDRGFRVNDTLGTAAVMFVIGGKKFRIDVPMPKRGLAENNTPGQPNPRGWFGWDSAKRQQYKDKQYEQACRERWRGFVLLVKAKLEAIRIGLSSIEREFAADLLLANGKTVHEQIAEAVMRPGAPVLMLEDGKQ